MDTVSDQSEAKDPAPPHTRRDEFIVFSIIAALIWPIVAVGIVGGYGFLVWMSQLVLGPPGPPPPH
ncbi:periplasmic nitrate reductase, NapE protein [Afipia sp. TerB]